jgi:hypothetical protein
LRATPTVDEKERERKIRNFSGGESSHIENSLSGCEFPQDFTTVIDVPSIMPVWNTTRKEQKTMRITDPKRINRRG